MVRVAEAVFSRERAAMQVEIDTMVQQGVEAAISEIFVAVREATLWPTSLARVTHPICAARFGDSAFEHNLLSDFTSYMQ